MKSHRDQITPSKLNMGITHVAVPMPEVTAKRKESRWNSPCPYYQFLNKRWRGGAYRR